MAHNQDTQPGIPGSTACGRTMFEENGILAPNWVTKQCNFRGYIQCEGGGNSYALGLRGGVMEFTAQQGRDRCQAKTSRETWSATLAASGRSQKMGC